MSKKPETLHDSRIVTYDDSHWELLNELRESALEVMQALQDNGVTSFVYGSVARGDVSKSSDIDIIIPYTVSSYKLEIAIGSGIRRELVQATPSMVLKGHIYLENDIVVTFPLFKFKSREEEFYRWGGQTSTSQLSERIRVPGVDKRLILIEPSKTGHVESGVIGYEHIAAKKVGVSIDIAKDRVRVLSRRDSVGRTGVYLTRSLSLDESFEAVAKGLVDSDPALRRTIQRREK